MLIEVRIPRYKPTDLAIIVAGSNLQQSRIPVTAIAPSSSKHIRITAAASRAHCIAEGVVIDRTSHSLAGIGHCPFATQSVKERIFPVFSNQGIAVRVGGCGRRPLLLQQD